MIGFLIVGSVLGIAGIIGLHCLIEEDKQGRLWFWILLLVIGCRLIGYYIRGGDVDDYKQQAIDKGYAHFVIVDKKSGRTEFQWKEIKPSKKVDGEINIK